MRYLFAFVLSLLSFQSFAAAGSVVTNWGNTYTASSSACADVLAGVDDPLMLSCTSDPVIVGTKLHWATYGDETVTSITATPSAAVPPSGGSSTPAPGAEITEIRMLTIVIVLVSLFFAGVAGYRQGASS